jgi:hypothetical protein
MKVTYEKSFGNAPTTQTVLSIGRVPCWFKRFKRKHIFNVRWKLLDEPQPKDMVKLVAAFRALGDW